MLRSEPETRANDLLTALILSAHHYEEAAKLLDDNAARVIHAIGSSRRAIAERIAEAIRLRGNLPDALDPERMEVGDLALRARTWWKGREHLLHETLAQENEELEKLCADVLQSVPDLCEPIESLRAHLRDAVEQLVRLHAPD